MVSTLFEWMKSAGVNEAKVQALLSRCKEVSDIDAEIGSIDAEIKRLMEKKSDLTAKKSTLEKEIVLSPSELFATNTQETASLVVEPAETIAPEVSAMDEGMIHKDCEPIEGVQTLECVTDTIMSDPERPIEHDMTISLSLPEGLFPRSDIQDLSRDRKTEINQSRTMRGSRVERLLCFIEA